MEGSLTREDKAAKLPAVEPGKAAVEMPQQSALGNIFAEVQLLMRTGPNSQPIEVFMFFTIEKYHYHYLWLIKTINVINRQKQHLKKKLLYSDIFNFPALMYFGF